MQIDIILFRFEIVWDIEFILDILSFHFSNNQNSKYQFLNI